MLTAVLLALLLSTVNTENCSVRAVNDVLQPLATDPSYADCQRDSSYTLSSFETPTRAQTRLFCASSACQALLNATLASGLLPDCNVSVGALSFNVSDVVGAVTSKCARAPKKFLSERAIDKSEHQGKAQRTSDHITSIIGHSAPMDEVGGVAGALMSLLR
ncbi:hypothetical protein PF005_g10176 [Phytophthora fragariae]|uniref:Elicitin n=1 Tax=Phytophthora fragariae TaxID=53985 RepID=A0A6A3ZI80_9STRA|nr:hypothetical protein PF003_g16860 [Phytophthora fragariae]KAE8938653.1 hypothetical protein PF009_g11467 [Phytophthora fragariae]KAE9012535.1 hypothetical protein PF011_g8871 [Phytophthora fragariae]KAE9116178.1 hypothetical protein PF007_g9753 [Phytophthora fragariae]KAE9119267.1 hypothetical protein PF010_g7928 [Phytophthora fragariae]